MRVPQEIMDHVIDHLWDDHSTLRIITLVGRSTLDSARHHLFNHVKVEATPPQQGRVTDEMDAFEALIGTHASSEPSPGIPLYNHVRTLSITSRPQGSDAPYVAVDVQRLILILHKLPALQTLDVSYIRFQANMLNPTLRSSLSLEAIRFCEVPFGIPKGKDVSPSVHFLRCFSKVDRVTFRQPSLKDEATEDPLFALSEPLPGGVLQAEQIILHNIVFQGQDDIPLFDVLKKAVDLQSIRSITTSAGYNHWQDSHIRGFIRSCGDLRQLTLTLPAWGYTGDVIEGLTSLPLPRSINHLALESSLSLTDSTSNCMVTTSSWNWIGDVLSIFSGPLQTFDIILHLFTLSIPTDLFAVFMRLNWDELRDCVRRVISRNGLPNLNLSVQVSILFADDNIFESWQQVMKEIPEDFEELRRNVARSFKEVGANAHILPFHSERLGAWI